MATYTGFVQRIGHKQSQPGAKRAWNLYSVLLEKEDGTTHPWISLGFMDEPPKIKEGDYITLQADNDDQNRLVFVKGTSSKPKNPPARAAKKPAAQGGGGSNGGGYRGKGGSGYSGGNKFDGTGIQNRSNPEDVKRMSYANARDHALVLLNILLENKALPLTGAAGKAGEAKRFDEIKAAADKLTVELFNDGMTLRKLETVSDAGKVDVAPDGGIPEEPKKHDIDSEGDSGSDGDSDDASAGDDGSGDDSGDDVI